jgi:transposase InsO family protein
MVGKNIKIYFRASDNPTEILEASRVVTENDQLKKLLGEKELENQILRDLLKKTNPLALKRLNSLQVYQKGSPCKVRIIHLKDECLSRYEFRNYCEAYNAVVQFVEFYNNRRIHGSIYGLSPMEYYKGVISNTIKPLKIKVSPLGR